MPDIEKLKYPIGRFEKPHVITNDLLNEWITDISTFPSKIIGEVISLTDEQLDTRYRPEGWTIRQVVHHCADSHLNSFIRLKLALTEEQPTVKPYSENQWAELDDSIGMPVESSLKIIEGIHTRWVMLLNNLTDEQFSRVFIHPEHNNVISIKENVGIYAWHCKHHLAHITEAKKRNNWNKQ